MYNNGFYPNNNFQYQNVQPQQQQSSGIVWVQGESGAKSYMVAPGNSVVLMDSERPTFYIKSTDANGMPQPLKIYDFVERQATTDQPAVDMSNYVTKDELKAYMAELTTSKTTKKGKANE